ncbi:hypothetical protein NQ176_g10416 [Zarea fungicola]|uniref:Uncharacterized protein n=1 Tax=Zarea fungicola TaxID=93591 RepID=A0ACC1MG92_9HYPO|nr:hypothetical protein NQ176_g10416 [Lecanicillium fungicola]
MSATRTAPPTEEAMMIFAAVERPPVLSSLVAPDTFFVSPGSSKEVILGRASPVSLALVIADDFGIRAVPPDKGVVAVSVSVLAGVAEDGGFFVGELEEFEVVVVKMVVLEQLILLLGKSVLIQTCVAAGGPGSRIDAKPKLFLVSAMNTAET